MDNSKLTGNRQLLLIGAAVTGLTLVIAYSIQPMLPLADVDRPPAVVDDEFGVAFAAPELEEPELLTTATSRSRPLESLSAARPAEASRSQAPPHRYIRNSHAAIQPSEAVSDPGSQMPAAYRDRMALMDQEREVALRRLRRDGALSPVNPDDSAEARVAMVSVEESADAETPVVAAAAETGDVREFQKVNRVRHHPLRPAPVEQPTRGAWLAGTIESD